MNTSGADGLLKKPCGEIASRWFVGPQFVRITLQDLRKGLVRVDELRGPRSIRAAVPSGGGRI